jgi:indolepyruvate ferredoxin oxidoreductase alpha subunit
MVDPNKRRPLAIRQEQCKRCGLCVTRLGCPAIFTLPPLAGTNREVNEVDRGSTGEDKSRVRIDPALCNGCGLCVKLCGFAAIGEEVGEEAREAAVGGRP